MDPQTTRALLEKFSSGIREAQKAKLDLEEKLQEERAKRLELERQNNFYRISNSQGQRDEIEVERLKAEIARLRNLVTEYKDQASFSAVHAGKIGERRSAIDVNLNQMHSPIERIPEVATKIRPPGNGVP